MLRVAINGYGRIGRNILRAYYERPQLQQHMKIVAINDLGDLSINQHLTQFDSVHGRFSLPVGIADDQLLINQDRIKVLSEREPSRLPWRSLAIDLVFECTGLFTERAASEQHIVAGAKKVLISAPGKNMDATIVYGVNDHKLRADHRIVSNASCTTNCLAPLLVPLQNRLGIDAGFMTTIHSYTNDQHLSDVYHSDVYRARSATQSMIPTKTGAAAAIGEVIPELAGKLDGMAVRVPTINVSLVDLTLTLSQESSAEEVNDMLLQAAAADARGVLNYSDARLVSIDFNHNAFSSNFDPNHTKVSGRMLKVMSWYDNEWGFSNRMLDTALRMASTDTLALSA